MKAVVDKKALEFENGLVFENGLLQTAGKEERQSYKSRGGAPGMFWYQGIRQKGVQKAVDKDCLKTPFKYEGSREL